MTRKLTPNWVPRTGLQLRLAGIHFDAIRVCGIRGEAVVHHLNELTGGRPVPVVREGSGCQWTYFLLAPGESAEHDWPPGARRFGKSSQDEYIGVPAPDGNTYPLSWRCGAPEVGEFVDAELLHGVLMAQLCRTTESPETPEQTEYRTARPTLTKRDEDDLDALEETDMALTREEREKFLAEPHVAAFSVNAGAGRAPLTVPVWYQYAPGGDIWIITGLDSRKNKLIGASGRFSLMVDRLEPTIRYVSVEGPVIDTVPATIEKLREISARYLPADKVDAYVDFAWKEHGEQVIVHMRPERWVSSDLGKV